MEVASREPGRVVLALNRLLHRKIWLRTELPRLSFICCRPERPQYPFTCSSRVISLAGITGESGARGKGRGVRGKIVSDEARGRILELWRTVKYEEACLRAYERVGSATIDRERPGLL
jgi:hypothetical protein